MKEFSLEYISDCMEEAEHYCTLISHMSKEVKQIVDNEMDSVKLKTLFERLNNLQQSGDALYVELANALCEVEGE